jgi:hypothetical protein
MSAVVQLINCQVFDLLLSLKLKSHILQTNSHFTPELSACALGNLTMHNLAYTARLFEGQRPNLSVIMKISFISVFFVLGWKFACVRLLPFAQY